MQTQRFTESALGLFRSHSYMPFDFPSNDFRENDTDIASVELVKPFQDSIVELSLETVKDGGVDRNRED